MYSFEIMHRDEVVTRVAIAEDRESVQIERLCNKVVKQPLFCKTRNDVAYVYGFLKSRCYQDNYAGLSEVLEIMGLESNDPYKFVRKTHGVQRKDFIWIRFPGENLTWDKVRLK